MEIETNDELQVCLKSGELITYSSIAYTDYMVVDNLFVVLRGHQWIGMYNLDCIESVMYIDDLDREEVDVCYTV